ncbi:MAG: hypothetical protein HYU25_09350 [Candidatus Rokubacteria bacterium]|nr:hypothetical protein [Candidatus Rokubacteria bacterium]
MIRAWLVAVSLVLASSAPALGGPPGAPNNPGNFSQNPHPAMPWATNSTSRVDYGQVVRYIPVPPQPVSLTVNVPVPDGVPPKTEQQTVQIPGYYVTETTTGFYYPERWTLQQTGAGVYQWVKLPPEFKRR